MPDEIGALFQHDKRITSDELDLAIDHQRRHRGDLAASLVALGYLAEGEVAAALSKHYGVPSIVLQRFRLSSDVLAHVPAGAARKARIVPLDHSSGTLTVATSDPTNVLAIDDLKFLTGCHVEAVFATHAAIADALNRCYPGAILPVADATQSIEGKNGDRMTRELELISAEASGVELLGEESESGTPARGEEAPVIRLVNLVLCAAAAKGASDVHIEPYDSDYRIRFRIDGILHYVMTPSPSLRDAVTSRIKIMARLDIAEKRLPQDGRIKIRVRQAGVSREIDVRVSCLPTLFGEKIVMRLLDRSKLMLDMTGLGVERESLDKLVAAIARPSGMVLVTGPTGSGKTSTLYSAIARLNTARVNIMTAEDPVEFNLAGVNQLQVRDQIGLTFATALRGFLRQDPNVILVGEIRDFETAEIAIKAALTGHLVLSTLHTSDAPGTVTRLINMGIEPFLIASSLNLVCAQRLVRRICPQCRSADAVSACALEQAGFTARSAREVRPCLGLGCTACNGTGYVGRVGLYEVMEITDRVRELIQLGTPEIDLRRRAIEEGMITLRESGLRKIAEGVTSLEEVLRETVH
jgi:type IV pilus assembly protein PilB